MNEHFKRGFNKGMVRGAVFSLLAIFTYLFGAFVAWDLNPEHWGSFARIVWVAFLLFAMCIFILFGG